MDLWIRSQDKLQLLKVEDLEVYDGGNKANNHFFIKCLGNYIGEYATKERALEVLDEIENFRDALNIIDLSDKRNELIIAYIEKNGSFTYKMPKE